MKEKANANSNCNASIIRKADMEEKAIAAGFYEVECIGADGKIKWKDVIKNVVTTIGKNLALDTFLAGSGYSVTGPYIGLISADSYGAGPVAADTMASHAGWLEAGAANAPTYSGTRKTAVFSAAAGGAKALSSVLAFAITGTGTAKGIFLVFGTGASSAIGNTGGTLYSAGLFTGGDKSLVNTDTLNVSYTATL